MLRCRGPKTVLVLGLYCNALFCLCMMSDDSGEHSCVSNEDDTMNEQDKDRDCMSEK